DSGEDIKKWENAAAYEPHDSEDDDDERMLMLLWGIAAKKYGEEPADCTEEGFYKFQSETINRLIAEFPKYKKLLPKKTTAGKKSAGDTKADPEIKPDAFYRSISAVGGSCKKKLEARKKVLEKTREYLAGEGQNSRPKKFPLSAVLGKR
ncbi:MAG: hypothetical protein NC078_12505, partial [Ruminococcus sp.]|nr:hypothetical protein [Ruminococcus sp.]